MIYELELLKLKEDKRTLIANAEAKGYTYDAVTDTFILPESKIYVIHISINTLGCGESLGNFEIYDKVFQVSEEFALESSKIDNLNDFAENVLFNREWDEEFRNCNVLNEVFHSDWFYHTTEESQYSGYENIITFRFSYIRTTMGNVSIIKCNPKILKEHSNIYHYTENYVIE